MPWSAHSKCSMLWSPSLPLPHIDNVVNRDSARKKRMVTDELKMCFLTCSIKKSQVDNSTTLTRHMSLRTMEEPDHSSKSTLLKSERRQDKSSNPHRVRATTYSLVDGTNGVSSFVTCSTLPWKKPVLPDNTTLAYDSVRMKTSHS